MRDLKRLPHGPAVARDFRPSEQTARTLSNTTATGQEVVSRAILGVLDPERCAR